MTVSGAYEKAVTSYNAAFAAMEDAGMSLLRGRERCVDLLAHIEHLINSVANTPKSFPAEVSDIATERHEFLQAEDFARKDVEAARRSALSAGSGMAAGAAVASVAPSAAMWVATTFGAASTGTAISTLSGAAASNAALAWLGGGALAAGGGGATAGGALLALSGPIGWSIAGVTLLTTITLYSRRKIKNRSAYKQALDSIITNTSDITIMDARIRDLLQRTSTLRVKLATLYQDSLRLYESNFEALTESQQHRLATLVNTALAAAALLSERIGVEEHPEPQSSDHAAPSAHLNAS